ncbi:hypothetical protein HOLleu_08422 [Holothuria leucospilota]|uniref:Uncharacterized protein n=1 Tax=Holothuria leucospilota TaxID=206669 RepID=A0A9Q1CIW8_HOLLE|nr:hypothetical protein HOLleu_08422 [Holothuria leucospilota]
MFTSLTTLSMGMVMQTNTASPFQLVPNTPSLVASTKVSSPPPIVPERCDIVSKLLSEIPITEATVPSTPYQCKKIIDTPGLKQQFSHNCIPGTPQPKIFYNSQEQRVPSSSLHNKQCEVDPGLEVERLRGKDRASIKRRRIALLNEGPQNKLKCKEPLFMLGCTDDIFG